MEGDLSSMRSITVLCSLSSYRWQLRAKEKEEGLSAVHALGIWESTLVLLYVSQVKTPRSLS